jgi:hypothetical protein
MTPQQQLQPLTHSPVVVVVLRQLVQLLQREARRRALQRRQHLPAPLGNPRHLVLALQVPSISSLERLTAVSSLTTVPRML